MKSNQEIDRNYKASWDKVEYPMSHASWEKMEFLLDNQDTAAVGKFKNWVILMLIFLLSTGIGVAFVVFSPMKDVNTLGLETHQSQVNSKNTNRSNEGESNAIAQPKLLQKDSVKNESISQYFVAPIQRPKEQQSTSYLKKEINQATVLLTMQTDEISYVLNENNPQKNTSSVSGHTNATMASLQLETPINEPLWDNGMENTERAFLRNEASSDRKYTLLASKPVSLQTNSITPVAPVAVSLVESGQFQQNYIAQEHTKSKKPQSPPLSKEQRKAERKKAKEIRKKVGRVKAPKQESRGTGLHLVPSFYGVKLGASSSIREIGGKNVFKPIDYGVFGLFLGYPIAKKGYLEMDISVSGSSNLEYSMQYDYVNGTNYYSETYTITDIPFYALEVNYMHRIHLKHKIGLGLSVSKHFGSVSYSRSASYSGDNLPTWPVLDESVIAPYNFGALFNYSYELSARWQLNLRYHLGVNNIIQPDKGQLKGHSRYNALQTTVRFQINNPYKKE